jgi:tetrahydromethanopterin S-methyltransferase subunit A
MDGTYIVGDPTAPVAICALTSNELLAPLARLPGVAMAGILHTANLGIERIVVNILANPAIRFLLVCGKESRLFGPGQSLGALVEHGVDDQQRIVGATGYEPILRNVTPLHITTFRQQVELSDWCDELDIRVIQQQAQQLAARNPGRFVSTAPAEAAAQPSLPTFAIIPPGGQREPLQYDPKGYFVISLDRAVGQIVVRHYWPDNTPGHEMRGRTAESMVLGLLGAGLISQMSHAGYLGAELAKAEAALHLGIGFRYRQDRLLQREALPEPSAPSAATADMPRTVGASQDWAAFNRSAPGETVDVVMLVADQPAEHALTGTFAEPDPAEALKAFQRTSYPLRVTWNADTQVAMGKPEHFTPGAILRIYGLLRAATEIEAQRIAVLTHVAHVA